MPKQYDVRWAQVAEEDLIEIAEFIAAENTQAALQIVKTIAGVKYCTDSDPSALCILTV